MNKGILMQVIKFAVAVALIVLGQWLLDVPDPEDFLQFLRHIVGVILIWAALDIDWMNYGK